MVVQRTPPPGPRGPPPSQASVSQTIGPAAATHPSALVDGPSPSFGHGPQVGTAFSAAHAPGSDPRTAPRSTDQRPERAHAQPASYAPAAVAAPAAAPFATAGSVLPHIQQATPLVAQGGFLYPLSTGQQPADPAARTLQARRVRIFDPSHFASTPFGLAYVGPPGRPPTPPGVSATGPRVLFPPTPQQHAAQGPAVTASATATQQMAPALSARPQPLGSTFPLLREWPCHPRPLAALRALPLLLVRVRRSSTPPAAPSSLRARRIRRPLPSLLHAPRQCSPNTTRRIPPRRPLPPPL